MKSRARIAAFSATFMWISGPVAAQECPDYNPERNPYFGDLHGHMAFSMGAAAAYNNSRFHQSSPPNLEIDR